MKILLTLFMVAFGLFSSAQQTDITELKNQLKAYKTEAKELLGEKTYDGSKTTYFTSGKKIVKKGVEVELFLRDNYTLVLNGKGAPTETMVRFYDKPAQDLNRILIKEITNIQGRTAVQVSKELREIYNAKVQGTQKLDAIFVEYRAKKSDEEKRGGMVLVLGY